MEKNGSSSPPFPLEQLSPELKVVVFAELSGKNLVTLRLVCKEWNVLVKSVFMRHGREHEEEVVFVQRWWKDLLEKRKEACLDQIQRRKLVMTETLQVCANGLESRQKCLKCREELLAYLDTKGKEDKEKEEKEESKPKKKGFFSRLLKGHQEKEGEENLFTVELVETVFHLPLLTAQVYLLTELHQGVKDALENYDDFTRGQRVAKVFIRFFEKIESVILLYAGHLSSARIDEILLDSPLAKQREKYQDFWHIAETNLGFNFGQSSNNAEYFVPFRLGLPFGWYARLGLMISDLLNHCAQYHPDRKALKECKQKIDAFCRMMNSNMQGSQFPARLCTD